MDNPQHYQPLSHALHAPSTEPHYTSSTMFNAKAVDTPVNPPHTEDEEEEDEEEEQDDDDEGLVEEQLNNNDANPNSNPTSPAPQPNNPASQTNATQTEQTQSSTQEPEAKRRPGRPRGSKNRKPRGGSLDQKTTFYYQGQSTSTTAPPQHPEVNAQNQSYYEFQWRVLNLCAEFYGAAEELVKSTPPLVVSQCYHMGPNVKVDPLIMLGEAKRVCDTLLANPSQLVSHPPPPMYPVIPTLYQPVHPQTAPGVPTSASAPASSSKPASTPTVISNAQSFIVPLSAQTAYPHSQFPVYPPPPGSYPTASYYYPHYGGSYYPQAAASTSQAPAQMSISAGPTMMTSTSVISPGGSSTIGNQGAWSDEETDRLKKLADENKVSGTGEIDWDRVVTLWGAGRTRHQILIRATALGLKESSSRGVKRRRETDGTGENPSGSVPPMPAIAASATHTTTSAAQPVASPALSNTASTPAASPALQNQSRPQSSKGHSNSVSAAPASSSMPWPMPTIAANTPPPVVAHAGQDQQRTSYYRPRPSQSEASSKTPSTTQSQHATSHHYMYQPNGGSGQRPGKENGK